MPDVVRYFIIGIFIKMSLKNNILPTDFFNRDTRIVAKELLGKVLYHNKDGVIYKAIISETEAYHSTEDLACHCSKGMTPRTEIMFDSPGHIYVYLIYGMYHMLNFVTMPKDFPAAVLIRAVQNLQISKDGGHTFQSINAKTDGPGKLTKQMQIDQSYNRLKLNPANNLWVIDENIIISDTQILTGKRIGVDYAKEWAKKPWRFMIK